LGRTTRVQYTYTFHFIERRNFRAALPSKMPLYPADTYANEYDEDEFVLECAREDGHA